jgi:hypothetical protein
MSRSSKWSLSTILFTSFSHYLYVLRQSQLAEFEEGKEYDYCDHIMYDVVFLGR